MSELRGTLKLYKEYRVYCADCGREEQLGDADSRISAEKRARELGWRHRTYGWFCPEDNGQARPGEYWSWRQRDES